MGKIHKKSASGSGPPKNDDSERDNNFFNISNENKDGGNVNNDEKGNLNERENEKGCNEECDESKECNQNEECDENVGLNEMKEYEELMKLEKWRFACSKCISVFDDRKQVEEHIRNSSGMCNLAKCVALIDRFI